MPNETPSETFYVSASRIEAETEHKWMREYDLNFSLPGAYEVNLTSIGQQTPLNIMFNITSDGTSSQENGMNLSVFGLSEDTIGKVTSIGTEVLLKVGYRSLNDREDMPVLFTGKVSTSKVISNGQKTEVKFFIRASELGSRPMLTTFNKDHTYQERIDQMIAFIQTKYPDLNTGTALKDLSKLVFDEPQKGEAESLGIPDRTSLTDEVKGTLSTRGTMQEELSSIFSIFHIVPKVTKGILRLVRKGGQLFSSDPVQALLGVNLISPPLLRMDNRQGPVGNNTAFQMYDMKMLLSPEIDHNSTVTSDHSRSVTGGLERKPLSIKVVSFSHSGAYYGQVWNTTVTGTTDQPVLKESSDKKSISQEYLDPGKTSQVLTDFSNTV